LFAAALFLGGSQTASALDAYTTAINAAIQPLEPGKTAANCSLITLEKAALQCIRTDATNNKNNAANYANAALAIRADKITIAADFAKDLAGQILGTLKLSATTLETGVAQGAIQAAPTISGSIAAAVLYSSTGVSIATSASNTWAYAYSLAKYKSITNNSDAIQQIATAIALSTNSALYPVITDPNQFSNDPRILLAVQLMKASPKTAYNIAYGIGQTLAIDFSPTGTGLPPYDQRERYARFASWLAASLPSSISGAAVAEGLIAANPEVAPRIVNEMLQRNATIAKSPDKFIQTVSTVVKSLDTGDILEIAAAISFGPGLQSLTPVSTFDPLATDSLSPFLTGSANATKFVSKLATVFSKQIVIQTGTAPTVGHANEVSNDLAVMEGILTNKLASIVVAQGSTAKSLSTFQSLVLTISSAASTAAKTAKLSPALQAQIANEVAKYVSEAIKTVWTTYNPLDKKNIYAILTTNLNKIASSKGNTVDVAAAVNAGFTGANFAWGTLTLNPDETPTTNF
jgi:hypothetical protein